MLKRSAAFLLILTIVGQVYAGVCRCLDGEGSTQHSCCKRQKGVGDSVSNKGCCETDCMANGLERPTQDRTTPSTKVKFETTKETTAMPKSVFERCVAFDIVRITPVTNHRLKFSRAPELYLRHRAFLI